MGENEVEVNGRVVENVTGGWTAEVAGKENLSCCSGMILEWRQ